MPQVTIENPVLNSPYREPTRHWRFGEDGITDDIVEGRRVSSYFMPIPAARKKGKAGQLAFDTEWTGDRVEENRFINEVRERVSRWRRGGHIGITSTTRRLLEHWTREGRERPLFFCQVEALETLIYLTEVARGFGDAWIDNDLRRFAADANPGLLRLAMKMATGSGKTVVMAMLIAWHTLNKLANAQAREFSDTFLVVTPGITIRDRLRVLLPNDPNNYYRALDVVPADLMQDLQKATILITNFHAFLPRERAAAGRLTKAILAQGQGNPFTESPGQMVRRVCRELGNKKNIVILNDEAHHCYRRRVGEENGKLTGDERREADRREEEARVWISGLDAVQKKIGVKAVYDLSATPFFLRGSGYPEGTLFPWVVSDFSLIDAIESGIVKVPRVPVSDDTMTGEMPVYRDLWLRIRDDLPKKGRKTDALEGEPVLPKQLEAALVTLYGHYERAYQQWEANREARARGLTPPVFIVVCNNTNVSKLVFDHVAGWQKALPDGSTIVVPGHLPIFSNELGGGWTPRPNTILVDSQQLDSGEGMSPEFKKIASVQIEEFKAEYRARFPGRDPEELTDEDLLREVMNTVGKPGKLGENVKCVVSVSMLTEGWDANTVTHILGVRAFGTQLLCEQVVGRGLRRMSYVADVNGMFAPEYAEVFGVPFSFIPTAGSTRDPRPGPMPTRVRALPERSAREITFPRVAGYRWAMPPERLQARFTSESKLELSAEIVPLKTTNAPIVGEKQQLDLYVLRTRREQEVAFELAKLTLDKYGVGDDGRPKPWLFPDLLRICRQWMAECVILKDDAFVQMLLLHQWSHAAAEKIHLALRSPDDYRKSTLRPVLRPYDTLGSTRTVDFDTTREVWATSPDKCHVSHVTGDSNWELKAAQALEEMDEVVAYVKNQGLGFTIPYTLEAIERQYMPDFIVHLDDGHGEADPLKLVLEITGQHFKDKIAKVDTARSLWVPAVNNHGGFGRWQFLELADPWDLKNTLRAKLEEWRGALAADYASAGTPARGSGGDREPWHEG